MLASSVTLKGQTTIPAKIREKLNIHAGDKVVFEMKDQKVYFHKIEPFDYEYHKSLSATLSEWSSKADDEAYNDL